MEQDERRPLPGLPGVTVQRDVPSRMRDGVTLFADVYRPAGEGPFPVILMRLPYDKTQAENITYSHPVLVRAAWLHGGGAGRTRLLPLRGRIHPLRARSGRRLRHDRVGGSSTGRQRAGRHVRVLVRRGHATHAGHLAATESGHDLPGADGLAVLRGLDLQPGGAGAGLHHVLGHRSGHPRGAQGGRRRGRRPARRRLRRHARAELVAAVGCLRSPRPGPYGDYFQEWLEHPTYDDYWRRWSIDEDYARLVVPALHVGGWYDIFLSGTVKNFSGMREGAGSEAARAGQKLLIGPWTHMPWAPESASLNGVEPTVVDDMQLRWFDHFLKGQETGVLDCPGLAFRHGRRGVA